MNILPFKEIQIATHNKDTKEHKIIVNSLFEYLSQNKLTNSLSCNQVGISDYRIGVIFVKRPLYFINPKITYNNKHIQPVMDSCITFPGKLLETYRYTSLTITADNFDTPFVFEVNNKYTNESNEILFTEIIAIQRMIDMLDKKTIFDKQIQLQTNKVNRNEIISIVKENKTLQIKNKFLQKFLKQGWKLK